MPDKDNDNKFMAMLERMGMVRKIDDDEPDRDFDTAASRKTQSYTPPEDKAEDRADNTGSRNLFGGSRQPTPGFTSPVSPATPPTDGDFDDYPELESAPKIERASKPEPAPEFPKSEESPLPNPEIRKSVRIDQSFWDESAEKRTRTPDAYADRYLEIDELYESFSMKASGTDTIYLIEEYLKSLPPSLPDESRREIITKILSASGFNYDNLVGDGMLRVSRLKDYAEQFAKRTDEYVSARNLELEALEKQMQNIRSMIELRNELHKKQFFSIEAEAQRLRDILSFISD